VGEPQTSGSTACDWVLTRHPAVRESILRTTDLLRTCPVDALFLTGGITLGAYSPEMSDIDLVVVLPAAAEGDESAQAAVLRIVDDLPPGIGMLLVKRDRLPASEPPALQVEGRWSRPYALHAMDVILLRDYSVPLFGADCRREMPTYAAADEISGIIDHVVNTMLPPAVAAVRGDPALALRESGVMGLTFLMARCLVTLKTGGLVSKPASGRWLHAEARRSPRLLPLAALARRFALWYERGMPKRVRPRPINAQFASAAAGFVSEVLHHRGIDLEPEALLRGDMFAQYRARCRPGTSGAPPPRQETFPGW
jgi:hypothetical protein